jgi:hypothetical protein
MISVILYGRNDSYGYNLHKRAALSINCIAEVLTGPSDEIVFVDYNTPDDYPTFPEAIEDTLTDAAKAKLRILRARSSIHSRYAARTHLQALEPVARNIALRRSNPANEWVLSTNTDILLVPRNGSSLTDLVKGLPDGHYGTARLELPESLWESLDRKAPADCIARLRVWGPRAYLNEVVYSVPYTLFDGPGDFQLIKRSDLFAIHGFDERMALGWHVDSNLAHRLKLLRGVVQSVLDKVYAYHCDHTRQITPAHKRERLENDVHRFIHEVTDPVLSFQADTWGVPDEKIEEIRLDENRRHRFFSIVQEIVPAPSKTEHVSSRAPDAFPNFSYVPAHVLNFLVDLFLALPSDTRIGWCGVRGDLFRLTSAAVERSGFVSRLSIDQGSAQLAESAPATILREDEWLATADILVFEFGAKSQDGRSDADATTATSLSESDTQHLIRVRSTFLRAVDNERERLRSAGKAPRRFIGVNCIHNFMESVFNDSVGITLTPFSTRVRHGFVIENENLGEQIGRLIAGPAGERVNHCIRSLPGRQGTVFYGPYIRLAPGNYRIVLDVEFPGARPWRPVVFDVALDMQPLSVRTIFPLLPKRKVKLFLTVPASTEPKLASMGLAEVRCFSFRGTPVVVRSCLVERGNASAFEEWFHRTLSPDRYAAAAVRIYTTIRAGQRG